MYVSLTNPTLIDMQVKLISHLLADVFLSYKLQEQMLFSMDSRMPFSKNIPRLFILKRLAYNFCCKTLLLLFLVSKHSFANKRDNTLSLEY